MCIKCTHQLPHGATILADSHCSEKGFLYDGNTEIHLLNVVEIIFSVINKQLHRDNYDFRASPITDLKILTATDHAFRPAECHLGEPVESLKY